MPFTVSIKTDQKIGVHGFICLLSLLLVMMALSFLSYNLKRVINILRTEEILRRLRENRQAVPVKRPVFLFFFSIIL